jgi:3-oxo-5-alpha-steroid 4-dehydrogenase 1
MVGSGLYTVLLLVVFAAAPVIYVALRFINAPYGRHNVKERSPWLSLPTRVAWVAMEFPASVFFVVFFALGSHALSPVPLVLLVVWESHYAHRTFVYPFSLRTKPGAREALWVIVVGFSFNAINAFLNATWISSVGYELSWFWDPRFIIGIAMFISGYAMNKWSDAALRRLRKPGETGYKVPRGGLYEWVSCPNYFGELIAWSGWAIASWSLPGFAFALFTAANLLPRARANHIWYHERFPDYPKARRAMVPLLF